MQALALDAISLTLAKSIAISLYGAAMAVPTVRTMYHQL